MLRDDMMLLSAQMKNLVKDLRKAEDQKQRWDLRKAEDQNQKVN